MLAFKSLAFYFCVYGEAILMSKRKAAQQRFCESAWFRSAALHDHQRASVLVYHGNAGLYGGGASVI